MERRDTPRHAGLDFPRAEWGAGLNQVCSLLSRSPAHAIANFNPPDPYVQLCDRHLRFGFFGNAILSHVGEVECVGNCTRGEKGSDGIAAIVSLEASLQTLCR